MQTGGYLFAYFAGEGTADGEQVRFGLSRGDDPVHYDDLHDARPVLVSTLGEGGIRDPYLVRDPAGDRFFLIATDLRIHPHGDWSGAVRTGSRSIVVWESHRPRAAGRRRGSWRSRRRPPAAPGRPRPCGTTSTTSSSCSGRRRCTTADDTDHAGTSHHRMMYATTRDFVTFSDARVWSDPGYSVIDSTLVRHDGWWYRFTKDERDPGSSSPTSKFITAERSRDLRSGAYEPVTDGIGRTNALGAGVEHGEGPVVVPSAAGDRWYLLVDEFGGRGYVPFESPTLDAPQWAPTTGSRMPTGARHGSVLPVTRAEHDLLRRAHSPGTPSERTWSTDAQPCPARLPRRPEPDPVRGRRTTSTRRPTGSTGGAARRSGCGPRRTW